MYKRNLGHLLQEDALKFNIISSFNKQKLKKKTSADFPLFKSLGQECIHKAYNWGLYTVETVGDLLSTG